MAITKQFVSSLSSDLDHPSNKTLLDLVLRKVCLKHGLSKEDYLDSYRDNERDQVVLKFKGVKLPPKFGQPIDVMKTMLDDPVRGPIIRAAVPDFSKAAERMIFLLGQMHNEYLIRVAMDEVRNLVSPRK